MGSVYNLQLAAIRRATSLLERLRYPGERFDLAPEFLVTVHKASVHRQSDIAQHIFTQ